MFSIYHDIVRVIKGKFSMISLEILLLGLGLAVDAGVVSFALGLTTADEDIQKRLFKGLLMALTFGFFQFFMLWLGSYGGYLFAFSSYGYLTQVVVCATFLLIGLKLFQEAQKNEQEELRWGFVSILALALATSIDALAAGISLGTLPDAEISALKIGIITFVVCSLFYGISFLFKSIPHRWLMRFGGIIFTGLGLRIVWHYISTGVA
jgi:putative Mn2+ efflux pump MntP